MQRQSPPQRKAAKGRPPPPPPLNASLKAAPKANLRKPAYYDLLADRPYPRPGAKKLAEQELKKNKCMQPSKYGSENFIVSRCYIFNVLGF